VSECGRRVTKRKSGRGARESVVRWTAVGEGVGSSAGRRGYLYASDGSDSLRESDLCSERSCAREMFPHRAKANLGGAHPRPPRVPGRAPSTPPAGGRPDRTASEFGAQTSLAPDRPRHPRLALAAALHASCWRRRPALLDGAQSARGAWNGVRGQQTLQRTAVTAREERLVLRLRAPLHRPPAVVQRKQGPRSRRRPSEPTRHSAGRRTQHACSRRVGRQKEQFAALAACQTDDGKKEEEPTSSGGAHRHCSVTSADRVTRSQTSRLEKHRRSGNCRRPAYSHRSRKLPDR